jgi:hypothetical protein
MPKPGLETVMATTLAAPLAAASPPRKQPFRPGRKNRGFAIALTVSAILHVLVFATVTFHFRIEPVVPRGPLTSVRVDDAMQAYDIAPVTVGFGVPEPEPLPARRPPVEVPIPSPQPNEPPLTGVAGATAPAVTAGARAGESAVERLSRGYRDPQLLAPVDRLPPEEVSEADWLRMRLADRLGLYNDSVAAEAAAKLRATDWTVKDKDGGRWGVSPGQIHLGKRTLPLPFGFSPPPGRRDEIAGRVRSWEESQAQAARVDAAETFEQRVKAIRARQEAARDSARKRAGGG